MSKSISGGRIWSPQGLSGNTGGKKAGNSVLFDLFCLIAFCSVFVFIIWSIAQGMSTVRASSERLDKTIQQTTVTTVQKFSSQVQSECQLPSSVANRLINKETGVPLDGKKFVLFTSYQVPQKVVTKYNEGVFSLKNTETGKQLCSVHLKA